LSKLNCWEFKKCGRELGGKYSLELGVCPASMDVMLDGVHEGVNAGRACWVLAGTMCNGEVTGTFAQKYNDCRQCDFYSTVMEEEGDRFWMWLDLLNMLEYLPFSVKNK
jgi:hypothetical protein